MNFKKWVKSIQTADYNGACMVLIRSSRPDRKGTKCTCKCPFFPHLILGLLFCALISDLRNQGFFQSPEKFKVLQTLIFYSENKLGFYLKSEKNLGLRSCMKFCKTRFCHGDNQESSQVPPSK